MGVHRVASQRRERTRPASSGTRPSTPSLYTSAAVHGGNTNPYILPQFDAVSIGWQEYQPSSETFEMWIDEVAIDSQRIGCVL